MTKKILIVVGTLLVLSIIGVWLYLFLSGDTSKTDGVFAGFGDGGNSNDVVLDDSGFAGSENTIAPATQRLRQVTLRPVVGAVIVDTGILFVEQGTGHVFHINLDTGNETLMSGTTLVGAWDAVFSPDGVYVAITSGFQDGGDVVVGSISPDGGLEGVSLPKNSSQVWFDDDNNLYYLAKDSRGSRGYVYDVQKASATELFNIPLRDVRVVWGDDIYVYTTPTAAQEGYVYKVVSDSLQYVVLGEVGMMAFQSPQGLVVGGLEKWGLLREYPNRVTFETVLLPEKCASLASGTVCAVPRDWGTGTVPDDWYKGVLSYSDSLFNINFNTGIPKLLVDLFVESGREVDVVKIGAVKNGGRIWFINKNDNSLWLFDASL